MSKTLVLVRRDPHSLSTDELSRLRALFGSDLSLMRIDSTHSQDHLRILREIGAPAEVFTYLPGVEPLPSPAMKMGYKHIFLGEDSRFRQLTGLPVQSKLIER